MMSIITSSYTKHKLHVENFLRENNAAGVLSICQLPFAFLSKRNSFKIKKMMNFIQYYPNSKFTNRLLKKIKYLLNEQQKDVNLYKNIDLEMGGMIIKPYRGPKEPGFILVKFEHELMKIARLEKFNELEKHYRILFFPSWTPFYSEALCSLDVRSTEDYFVMPSHFYESFNCSNFSQKCIYLPFHSASWTRADLYSSTRIEKTIDILMVANFSRHKRHWKLFEALEKMSKNIKVTLAGIAMDGRTKESLLKEARLFGVDSRISIIEGASDHPAKRKDGMPTVYQLFQQARLSCVLTFKEGSCNGVSESLMAGTPVAMYKNAKIGTKAYINENTGFLLDTKKPLHTQLSNALEQSNKLNSQEWAKNNISAEVNCQKLNHHLREWSLNNGLEWSSNIHQFFHQHLEFRYFDESVEILLHNEYEYLKNVFGLSIKRK